MRNGGKFKAGLDEFQPLAFAHQCGGDFVLAGADGTVVQVGLQQVGVAVFQRGGKGRLFGLVGGVGLDTGDFGFGLGGVFAGDAARNIGLQRVEVGGGDGGLIRHPFGPGGAGLRVDLGQLVLDFAFVDAKCAVLEIDRQSVRRGIVLDPAPDIGLERRGSGEFLHVAQTLGQGAFVGAVKAACEELVDRLLGIRLHQEHRLEGLVVKLGFHLREGRAALVDDQFLVGIVGGLDQQAVARAADRIAGRLPVESAAKVAFDFGAGGYSVAGSEWCTVGKAADQRVVQRLGAVVGTARGGGVVADHHHHQVETDAVERGLDLGNRQRQGIAGIGDAKETDAAVLRVEGRHHRRNAGGEGIEGHLFLADRQLVAVGVLLQRGRGHEEELFELGIAVARVRHEGRDRASAQPRREDRLTGGLYGRQRVDADHRQVRRQRAGCIRRRINADKEQLHLWIGLYLGDTWHR